MSTPSTVTDVVAFIESRYPTRIAAEWDTNGLTCGDPSQPVETVLFAVDPVMTVVDEAIAMDADMIITHHPLLLRGVHSVAATDHKGKVVHELIRRGIALMNVHTSADHGMRGVSDALAAALGIHDLRPLVPLAGDSGLGTGRVGELTRPIPLRRLGEQVAAALPPTHHGVRVAGDLDRVVRTVAVCGGSGDAYLADAARLADAYVTADLRHHRAQDHLMDGGCGLIDVSHWASEWPWLAAAAEALRADATQRGSTVEVHVSTIPTDPWSLHLGSTR
ncbi:MAG: Nif3-like dinuclear metal center hexameric protein [Actinomycetales bacterium]|nr:Nif3-like dinuclear metal center hexameric protein [Actinomycetales bacterium]